MCGKLLKVLSSGKHILKNEKQYNCAGNKIIHFALVEYAGGLIRSIVLFS